MNTLLSYLLLIPIAFFWLYYMIGVVSLFLIFIGLFLNIFFPPGCPLVLPWASPASSLRVPTL